MGFYLASMTFVFLTLTIAFQTRRKFEECLPIAVIASIFFLMMFGVFGILRFGVYALVAVSICSLIYFLLQIKQKKVSLNTEQYFTPGFFLFLGFVLIIPWICRGLRFNSWDEFSHWGLAVKDMYLFDAMAYRADAYVTMQEYPPYSTLFQYYFLKLYGQYSEPIVYAAHNLMSLVLVLPMTKRIEKRNWAYIIPLAVIFVCFPLYIFPKYWNQLYMDFHLGLALGYSVWTYFCDKEKDGFSLFSGMIAISFITMLKNTGIEYIIIPMGIILFDYLLVQRKDVKLKRMKLGRRIACVSLCLLIAFGARGIFNIALLQNGRKSPEIKFATKIINVVVGDRVAFSSMDENGSLGLADVTEAAKVVSVQQNSTGAFDSDENSLPLGGRLQLYQLSGIEAFIHFWDAAKYTFGPFYISYWFLYVILVFIGILLLWSFRNESDNQSIRVCIVGLHIGFWVYAVITAIGILFMIAPRAAAKLTSFDRYMDSCYWMIILVYLALILQRIEKRHLLLFLGSVACFALLAASPRDLVYQVGLGYFGEYENSFDVPSISDTFSSIKGENVKVAFVSQGNEGDDLNMARYYLMPLRIAECIGWNFVEDSSMSHDRAFIATPKSWMNALLKGEFTHVYIHRSDLYFSKAFASLFESEDSISDRTLYEIEPNEDGIRLIRVA